MRKSFVIIKTVFDALHRWPDAPNFLKYPHHHRFFVTVQIETIPGDMNRTLEFFEVRKVIDDCIKQLLSEYTKSEDFMPFMPTIDNCSTEKFSDDLYEKLTKVLFPDGNVPTIQIEVMEDNYAGSRTIYSKETN